MQYRGSFCQVAVKQKIAPKLNETNSTNLAKVTYKGFASKAKIYCLENQVVNWYNITFVTVD